jgi:4-alpha-glucanotransferase
MQNLVTFPGFWRERDLTTRMELGLYPAREAEALAREYRSLIKAFRREGLLSVSFPDDTTEFSFDLAQAANRFLACGPTMLLLLHLEDALGEENRINMLGTVAEHLNCRRKMPIDLDELERDLHIVALAVAFRYEQRAGWRGRRGPQADGG